MARPRLPHHLPLTGERTAPGIWHEQYWFMRHVRAYRFAAARCRGGRVLDAGCGEGYGTALLADAPADAVGVEFVADVVEHARAAYPSVTFVQGDLAQLPFEDRSFDSAVCLQVVEHLPDLGRAVGELARVLRPGGELLCATPNRLTFTPGSETPVNPFHVKEFTAAELEHVLAPHFRVKTMLGVHHGPRIRALHTLTRRSIVQAQLASPPEQWPRWLRTAVPRVTAGDFPLRADALDASLDLLAIATPA